MRLDVAESMGVTLDSFECLWDYCFQQIGWNKYDTLQSDEQSEI